MINESQSDHRVEGVVGETATNRNPVASRWRPCRSLSTSILLHPALRRQSSEECPVDGTPSSQTRYVARLVLQSGPNAMQGVFTYLIDNLGAKDVQFEELISLDSESLRQQRCVVIGGRTWTSTQPAS